MNGSKSRGVSAGLCAVGAILAMSGCAAHANGTAGAGGGSESDASMTGCSPDQLTEPCQCASGSSGRRLCIQGDWNECTCAADVGSDSGTGTEPPGNHRADITFTWNPAAPSQCLPGHYEGMFSCTLGGFPLPITGPISLDLVASANGETLDIGDGLLDGLTGGTQFVGMLVGSLDCNTLELAATIMDGVYGPQPAAGQPLVPWGMFAGALDGTYNTTDKSLSGMWNLASAGSAVGCEGPWTVTLTP